MLPVSDSFFRIHHYSLPNVGRSSFIHMKGINIQLFNNIFLFQKCPISHQAQDKRYWNEERRCIIGASGASSA
jgi:hypothetical protein